MCTVYIITNECTHHYTLKIARSSLHNIKMYELEEEMNH